MSTVEMFRKWKVRLMLTVSFTLLSAVVAIVAVLVVGTLLLLSTALALLFALSLITFSFVLIKTCEAVLFGQINGTCGDCVSLFYE